MTNQDESALARRNGTVKFAYLGVLLADRLIFMRKIAPFLGLPNTTFRTWLQAGMKDKRRGRQIQEDVELKLGIIITESPYE